MKDSNQTGGSAMWNGRVGDWFLRVLALGATLSAAIVMGTNKQTIIILTAKIRSKYSYSPAFKFFVVANAIACAYAFLSLLISAFNTVKARSRAGTQFILFLFDLVAVALVTAGASAATAIAYVGHKGNSHTQWMAICKTFDRFCDHVGGALVSSFIAVLVFMALTVLSSWSLYKHSH